MIAHGHRECDVWRYTPGRTFAYYAFHQFNRLDELRQNLAVTTLGAQGDSETIEKQMKKWEL